MSSKIHDCPRCGISARLQKRTFSDQALSALVVWGDMESDLVGHAICDSCYSELRDVLIERSSELTNVPTTLVKAS